MPTSPRSRGALARAAAAAAAAATLLLGALAARPAMAWEEPAPLSSDGSRRAVTFGSLFPPAGIGLVDRASGVTRDVSVDWDQRLVSASQPAIDGDGDVVAFASEQPLRRTDTDALADVYVRDMTCRGVERVSLTAAGAAANGASRSPAISASGRFVAFVTQASNLAPEDRNGSADVVVRDRATGTTRIASLDAAGRQSSGLAGGEPPAISADGGVVAFVTRARLTPHDTDAFADVYVRDLDAGTTERISVDDLGRSGSGFYTGAPSISADGRFVAFVWQAPRDGGGFEDRGVWVRDRVGGTTERVSTWPGSGAGFGIEPSISADGRRVAFLGESAGVRTADVWVRDRVARTTTPTNAAGGGPLHRWPQLSGDGAWVSATTMDDSVEVPTGLAPGSVAGGASFHAPCLPDEPGSAYRRAVLDDAPVGYWRFGEAPGAAKLADEQRRLPGIYSPAISLGVPGAIAGDPDTAFDFDGQTTQPAGQFVRIEDRGPLAFPGRAPFTVEAWIRPRALNDGTRRIVSKEGPDGGYLLGVRRDGLVFSRFAAGRWSTVRTDAPVDRWSHVAATYDGVTTRLYLDGTLRASRPDAIALPTRRGDFSIGALLPHWRFYAGGLDELAVYDHALPAGRVAAHASTANNASSASN